MKDKIFTIISYLNISLIIVSFGAFFLSIYITAISPFLYSNFFFYLRYIMSFPILALWVNTIIIWSKHDKRLRWIFLLFFFPGLFNPFYFLKAKKKGWI